MALIYKGLLSTLCMTSMIACSSPDPATGAGGSTGGTAGSTNSSSPLELTIKSKYSTNTSSSSVIDKCTIPSGTLPTDPFG